MKKHLYSLILIFLLAGAPSAQLYAENTVTPCQNQEETWLTIIVHGIINPKPHISLSNIILVMRDQIENSLYAHTVDITRNDPFFYQYHPMQAPGLQKIDMHDFKEGSASTAFAHVYDAMSKLNQKIPCTNEYYTFGWSGLLGTKIRTIDAEIFYWQLTQELKKYHAQNIFPKIRIIGYSHGGHITLHLATIHAKQETENALQAIDEVILLGLPVVCDTDHLVAAPLFKKVFHVYSPGDRVQISDFLACHRFLSNRMFKSRSDFTIPDNLYQIELRWKRLARTKKKYTFPHYPKWLIRNADPGHTELFSFGWIYNYRDYMPFYPLPAVCYLGYILQAIEQAASETRAITVDIRPFQDCMFLQDKNSKKINKIPFLTQEQQEYFRCLVNPFKPQGFNHQVFSEKTAKTLSKAKKVQKKLENQQKQVKRDRHV